MIKLLLAIYVVLFSLISHSQEIVELNNLINQAINDKIIPSAQLLIGKGTKIIHSKAYGQVNPLQSASENTLYDLASLTKPLATTTAILRLIDQDKLHLSDKVSTFYSQFSSPDKKDITIEDLLRHEAGLPPVPAKKNDNFKIYFQDLLAEKLAYLPRSKSLYSDVSFLILGKIVEDVSNEKFENYISKNIFSPLKMNSTFFCNSIAPQFICAPTTEGPACQAADPIVTAFHNQPLGHAGLFSTASDISKLIQLFLGQTNFPIISPTILKSSYAPSSHERGLGWDMKSSQSTVPRGDVFPVSTSFGHTGYTGTMIWVDPKSQGYVIFLTNRILNDGSPSTRAQFLNLRRQVSNIAAQRVSQP